MAVTLNHPDPIDPDEALRHRIVRIDGEITENTSVVAIAKLLFLQHQNEKKPITLRIESPGGSLTAGLAIVDTVKELRPLVRTRAPVMAHGVALIVLASGRKGERSVGTLAELSLTPIKNVSGSPTEANRLRHQIASKIAELCGQPAEAIAMHMLVGLTLTAHDAVSCGLADRIEVT